MARLKCPQCRHVFAPAGAGEPRCPECGYQAAGSPSPSYSQAAGPANPAAPYPMAPPGGTGVSSSQAAFQPVGQPTTHWASVTSLVMGILGFVGPFVLGFLGPVVIIGFLFPVGAIVFGSIGIGAANKAPDRVGGKGMAIAGLVLGIVQVALGLLMVLFVFVILEAIFDEFLVLAAQLLEK